MARRISLCYTEFAEKDDFNEKEYRTWQYGIPGEAVKNAATAVNIVTFIKAMGSAVGGESDYQARPLDYAWVLDLREQCVRKNVSFAFRQVGTYFIKDGKHYTLQKKDLCSQAKKAGIDYKHAIK